MTVIVCDFETYYSQQYSLSKVTTEEYVRDSRFEAIGVAVKVDDGETQWFSGTAKQTKAWLNQFDWGNSIAIAHNAMFDMAIMNWRFDIRPKRIVDTLSMARAIDGPDAGNSLAKLAERHGLGVKGTEAINALGKRRLDFTPEELAAYGYYCINDTEMTYKLAMKLLEGFPKEAVEWPMDQYGVRLLERRAEFFFDGASGYEYLIIGRQGEEAWAFAKGLQPELQQVPAH